MKRTTIETDCTKFYPMFFEKGLFTNGKWKHFEHTHYDMFLPYEEYKIPICFSTYNEALNYIIENG